MQEELAKCQLLCKDCHLKKTQKEARKAWFCNDISYKTCREMSLQTGLNMDTIFKFTDEDGIFDLEAYRNRCIKLKKKPKV